jgi:hypothetical protein
VATSVRQFGIGSRLHQGKVVVQTLIKAIERRRPRETSLKINHKARTRNSDQVIPTRGRKKKPFAEKHQQPLFESIAFGAVKKV